MARTISPVHQPWPVWTNADLQLYHGTTTTRVESILQHGIDVTRGSAMADFGRGFYTTTDEGNARLWSQRKANTLQGQAALIRLTFGRLALSKLQSIVFVRSEVSASDYWSFVAHCRSGLPHRPETGDFYDIAYGPVAKVWFGVSNSATFAGYDQISFHTKAAQDMLNDRSACALELLS